MCWNALDYGHQLQWMCIIGFVGINLGPIGALSVAALWWSCRWRWRAREHCSSPLAINARSRASNLRRLGASNLRRWQKAQSSQRWGCGNTQVKLNGKSLAKAYAKEISHFASSLVDQLDCLRGTKAAKDPKTWFWCWSSLYFSESPFWKRVLFCWVPGICKSQKSHGNCRGSAQSQSSRALGVQSFLDLSRALVWRGSVIRFATSVGASLWDFTGREWPKDLRWGDRTDKIKSINSHKIYWPRGVRASERMKIQKINEH